MQVEGSLELRGATIGGEFNCKDSRFISAGTAIDANSATIGSNVSLYGSQVEGKLSLRGASIGGHLNCSGGKFTNEGKTTINANGATIAASVFLRNGFEAQGEVNLLRASIGGNLECDGGKFTNEGKTAINADSATIASNVFFRDGFEARGKVNLFRASIGGNFQCNGRFLNKKTGIALDVGSTTIGGSVLLGRGYIDDSHQSKDIPFQVEGKVTFLNAAIDDRLELNDVIVLTLPVFWWKWYCNMRNDQSLKTEVLDLWSTSLVYYLIFERTPVLDLRFAKANIFRFYEREAKTSWIKQLKPGQLCLNGFVYSTIDTTNDAIRNRDLLKWLRLQIKDNFASQTDENFALQPYEQMAAVLKASGHQEAATEVLIAKEDNRRRYGGLSIWGKALNWFLGITIAHGYRPQRALLYSLLVILLGWGVFTAGNEVGLMAETSDSSKSYAVFSPLAYSFDTFTPIIDLHQENAWLPDASKGQEISLLLFKAKQGELLRFYFWFQIVAGWVLTSLWVAGFTGLVRNQR